MALTIRWRRHSISLEQTFLPALRLCGAKVELKLERHGFYPKGGGRIRAHINGPTQFVAPSLLERGEQTELTARVICAGLPEHVGAREAAELATVLGIDRGRVAIEKAKGLGPGNAVHIRLGFDNIVEVVSGFGDKGVPAERVARTAATEAHTYLSSSAPVGEHLADQLIIPMALAKGGVLRCTTPSLHTRTNADVVASFLAVEFDIERERDGQASYTMRANERSR